MNEPKTFAVHTLGCKVNQEEGAELALLFSQSGYEERDFAEPCDIYIINTCTVTHLADSKSRRMIRRAKKNNPRALLIVTGCYAQTSAAEVAAIEGVDLVAGVGERAILPELAARKLLEKEREKERSGPRIEVSDIQKSRVFQPISASFGRQPRVRAYLKVEDGCDQNCAYCIVPQARGPVRSLPPEQALARAAALLAAGHKEIVLSGIHVGAYGKDLPQGDLPGLVESLLALPGLLRLRLSSLEPQQIGEGLLRLMRADERICRHLHIPLQSGCDKTLAAMGRRYDAAQYAGLLCELRRDFPDIAITTDMIVGFPGESEEDFRTSLIFAEEMAFADIHVFPFSLRKGTPAAALPGRVPAPLIRQRAALLGQTAQKLASAYAANFIGRSLRVLAEQTAERNGRSLWFGHSDNYLSVVFSGENAERGRVYQVLAEEWQNGEIFACMLHE
ncbi:MAG: tRNA (N(6)-L-threonylcarbamoyladenosine(37)-C(2))-methylthiotransferase MtaB [Clostridiales bacterium]|nr:tRNA (N(6)-L-threonylcarbamoyladenosine(37)-C(2))-methylthiotransferase MtaB [Clostridiales bacterium]